MRQRPLPLIPIALLAGLLATGLTTCQTTSRPLEQLQEENQQVIKQLQRCLNQQDWPGTARLFANHVRCKGPATRYQERLLPRQRVLTLYQPPGAGLALLEITQLYAASQHHVVAEVRLRGRAPVCLIYTIEHGQITRQYTY